MDKLMKWSTRFQSWLKRRYRKAITAMAIRELHSSATHLYKVREAIPESEEAVNRALDELIYPAINELRSLQEEL